MASEVLKGDLLRRKGEGYVVARADEIAPGQRKIVNVAGREIGVFNLHGEYYALRNVCPHKAGPLCLGRIRPLVVDAGVYGVQYVREDAVIKCPWHLWEFDIKTGRSIHDPNVWVRSYPVCQEGDEIVLYLNRGEKR